MAEFLACIEGLALASDMLIQRIRLESDYANVIKNLTSDGMGSYGQIIREIKVGRRRFEGVEFVLENHNVQYSASSLLAAQFRISLVGMFGYWLNLQYRCIMHAR